MKQAYHMTAIALSTSLLIGVCISAAGAPVGIASGQPTGTNFPMVEDIKAACSTPSSPITNIVTNGAIDNIGAVFNDKTTQYGVADETALAYMKLADPKMMDNIVMVFPFFSTDMHLVVASNSPIKTLNDLQGKRVIEGPNGSGTWVSTQVLRGLTKLSWAPSYEGQAEGLAALKAGKVDAMFITAGAPVGMLRTATGIRLVPLQHPALNDFKYFTSTSLPSTTYPLMGGQTIPTYKVRNGLVTYNYRNQYQAEIAQLVTCITRKLPALQAGKDGGGKDGNAHPKWRDVNVLDIDALQWPVHPSAAKAIKAASSTK